MDNDIHELVKAKDFVILNRGNFLMLHQLCNKPRLKCSNFDISLENIIGKPFNSTFKMELMEGTKCKYILQECLNVNGLDTEALLDNMESGGDNRDIQDDNTAQILTKNEITDMKENGLSSDDILQQLMTNSKTFQSKTGYAQEKYLLKKNKKHSSYIKVQKPTIRSLCEILLRDNASQILGIRCDTISQIVSCINLQPTGKYILYENNCQGLLIATILNHLSDGGKLLNVTTPSYAFYKRKALHAMQFDEAKMNQLIEIPIHLFTQECVTVTVNEDGVIDERKRKSNETDDVIQTKRAKRIKDAEFEINELNSKKADGIIIACKEVPNSILYKLLDFLNPSRPFVIYSQFQEPLTTLYSELRLRKDIIYLRLFENWMRKYQIMPERTHPDVLMNSNGGYLLNGILVQN